VSPLGPSSQRDPSEPSSSEPSPQPTADPSQPAPRQSPPSQPTSTQPKVINSVQYRCDQGKGFKAVFLSNETVRTTFGSKVLTLPQVESGSGFRYSDDSVTLVGKGNTASVEVGDRVLFDNCVAGGSVRGLW
jgi:membrane-bound inhibitor of C-type lysozyme